MYSIFFYFTSMSIHFHFSGTTYPRLSKKGYEAQLRFLHISTGMSGDPLLLDVLKMFCTKQAGQMGR